MLLKTPLNKEHRKLGATMVDFGGWDMPVQYTNVIDEHTTTRTKAGLFDICHMGEFEITGPDSFAFIQMLITNDISKLVPGKALYSTICRMNGTIIDDSFIYMFDKDRYMIVVNAANIKKDFDWMKSLSKDYSIILIDKSDATAKIDLQGPASEKILQRLTDFQLSGLSRFFFVEDKVANIPALISRTGYTGEDGFELYFVADKAPEVWNKLLESGEIYGIKPCGLGARDTLRLESSYSLYGSDIDDSATPLEAGLGWQVRFKKENFIGKTALSKQKEQGIKRQIICFELDVRAVPRHHHKIMKHDAEIGHVTSGTFSPTFKKGLGMGYVKTEYSEIGTKLDIMIRDRKYPATVVKRPFYEFRQLEKGN